MFDEFHFGNKKQLGMSPVPPNRFSVKCLTELADERH